MALTDLLIASAIGIAFGFALERAGLASARNLTGQFFLTDLTVFKVMFTAIVTAMLGTFWLGRLGLMDVAFIYVPETYLTAQVAGELIFGAGFALAGLCPGTSCVAAASGQGDGAMVAVGLFAGVLVTGFFFVPLQGLYTAGARGAWTLPQLRHLPYGVVVFGVVRMALAGFAAAARLEARPRARPGSHLDFCDFHRGAETAAPLWKTQKSRCDPRVAGVAATWLAMAAIALGAGAAATLSGRSPSPSRYPRTRR